MKLKEILFAFGLSIILGYLYLSGRIVIESAVDISGYNYLDLIFDFNDYAYYGFLFNINPESFLFLIIISTLFYFFTPLPFNLKYIKLVIEHKLTYLFKYYIKKQTNLNQKSLFKQIVKKNYRYKIRNRKKIIANRFLGSYIFMILISLFMMSFLTKIVDFVSLGKENAIKSVLFSKQYISIQDKKFFKLICGKDKCVYSSKSLDDFRKIKEENYQIKNLIALQNERESKKFQVYVVDTLETESKKRILLQITYDSKVFNKKALSNIEFRIHTQDNNPFKPTPSFYKRCFKSFNNESTHKLNSYNIDPENDLLPYFTYVEIPINQKISYVELYNPAKSIKTFNYCN